MFLGDGYPQGLRPQDLLPSPSRNPGRFQARRYPRLERRSNHGRSAIMTTSDVQVPTSPIGLLTTSPIPELRKLEVTETEREVVITGRVSSFYIKQLAQESIRSAVAGRRLQNRVEVGC